MMNYNNIIKVAATLSLATLFSCAEMEDPQSGAVGYLAAPAFEVDVTVQDMAQTKASKPAVESPATSDIHFVVKDKDGNVKYDANGLWTEALVLPVGAYTVDAVYGSNGFGAPYFTGTASGNIDPLDSEVPALTMSLANSLVCVELDSEFAQHFDVGSTKVVLKSGSASAEVGYGQWIYVSSGADLEVTMAGVTAGESVTLTHKLSSPSPKVAYNLVCKKSSTSWPSIAWQSTTLSDGAFEGGLYFLPASATNMSAENAASMVYQVKGGSYSEWTEVSASDVNGYKYISGLSNGVTYSLRASVGNIVSEEQSFTPVTFQNCFSMGSVTAAHNNNGNADVELSSTTMTAGSMEVNLPATIAKMATVKAAGSFSSSNNAATGSFSDVALSTTSQNASFTNATDWPYLPQGTYSAIVTATCTLNGATFTATATKTATVPAPVFKVLLSAYTSYDKAKGTNGNTKDIAAANNCDPGTLYNLGASWTISDAVMANPNYAKTLVIDFNGDKSRTYNVTGEYGDNQLFENKSGLAWTNYTLQATFTFDGVTKQTDKQTHYITGLPYIAAPPSNTGEHTWTEDQRGWGVVYFQWNDTEFITWNTTGSGNTNIIGSPSFFAPSDISVGITLYAHGYYDSTWPGYEYDVKVKVHAGGNTAEFTADGSDNDYDKHDISSLSLTSDNSKIQIENTHYSGNHHRLYLKSVSVHYR